MKKFVILSLALALSATMLTGCGCMNTNADVTTLPTNGETSAPTTRPTTAPTTVPTTAPTEPEEPTTAPTDPEETTPPPTDPSVPDDEPNVGKYDFAVVNGVLMSVMVLSAAAYVVLKRNAVK